MQPNSCTELLDIVIKFKSIKKSGSNISVWPDNLHQLAAEAVGNTDLLLVHISNEVMMQIVFDLFMAV